MVLCIKTLSSVYFLFIDKFIEIDTAMICYNQFWFIKVNYHLPASIEINGNEIQYVTTSFFDEGRTSVPGVCYYRYVRLTVFQFR